MKNSAIKSQLPLVRFHHSILSEIMQKRLSTVE